MVNKIQIYLNKLPVSAGCVALGLIGLAILLDSYHPIFFYLFAALSVLFQAVIILKLVFTKSWRSVLSDYSSFSNLAGTTMALMLTAAQLKIRFDFTGAVIVWNVALIAHILIMILFSKKVILKRPDVSLVRGSWLLVYVGIAAASITAPAFSVKAIGQFLLMPAALGVFVLLPLVYYSSRKSQNIPVGQRPLFCITAAPVSIWLTGYLNSSASPSRTLVILLVIAAQIIYVPALLQCIHTFKNAFSPAIAAYTFPFVISAIALKQSLAFLGLSGSFWLLITAETMVALCLCLLTSGRYIRYLITA